MAERAVFLDRDDTIIDNDGYLGDPAKVKLLPGAATALAAIRALGYRLIVVSNQSGVARGIFDEAAVEVVNNEMSRQLREQAGAYIDASYYCPYHPEAVLPEYRVDHEWRKPRCGMLKQAAADFGLDLGQSWMIGDQGRDVAAGVAAGCRTILLRNSDRVAGAAAGNGGEALNVSPNFVVKTLADAARIIAREGRSPPPPAMPSRGVAGVTTEDAAALPQAAEQIAPARVALEPAHGSGYARAGGELRRADEDSGAATLAEPARQTAAPMAPMEEAPGERISPGAAPLAREEPRPERTAAAHAAERWAGGRGEERVGRQLEELVVLLRQQNRNAELRPEFSMASMGALILQVLAIVALVIGLTNHFTSRPTFTRPEDYFLAQQANEAAILWTAAAAALQGMVIALLIHTRQK